MRADDLRKAERQRQQEQREAEAEAARPHNERQAQRMALDVWHRLTGDNRLSHEDFLELRADARHAEALRRSVGGTVTIGPKENA